MTFPDEPVFSHPHVARADGRWVLPTAAVGLWGLRRVANGSFQAIWTCERCSYRSTPVPHQFVPVDMRALPIIIDYAGQFARCIVRGCDADEVELNHFGPRAVFGADAERWPTGYLCPTHHREWGERVTPQLNRRRSA